MQLKEIAQKISAHLKRLEADPAVNARGQKGGTRFWQASAWASGRYVSVRYVSYQGVSNMTKDDALLYLQLLDDGSTDKHFHALAKFRASANDSGSVPAEQAETEGERRILAWLATRKISVYYGRNGWTPNALPRGARRADFDAVIKKRKATVAGGELTLVGS